MSGYFLLRSETAYQGARKVLEERFGDPLIISEHFRKRLLDWPKVEATDGKGVRSLGDFLTQCEAAMLEIRELSILNDPQEIAKILQHLPNHIIHGWNRRVAHYRKEKGRYPDFATFSSFISDEADIACVPLTSFSSIRTKKDTKESNERPRRQGPDANVLVTDAQTEEVQRPFCIFCNKCNHSLSSCRSFADRKRGILSESTICALAVCLQDICPGIVKAE